MYAPGYQSKIKILQLFLLLLVQHLKCRFTVSLFHWFPCDPWDEISPLTPVPTSKCISYSCPWLGPDTSLRVNKTQICLQITSICNAKTAAAVLVRVVVVLCFCCMPELEDCRRKQANVVVLRFLVKVIIIFMFPMHAERNVCTLPTRSRLATWL